MNPHPLAERFRSCRPSQPPSEIALQPEETNHLQHRGEVQERQVKQGDMQERGCGGVENVQTRYHDLDDKQFCHFQDFGCTLAYTIWDKLFGLKGRGRFLRIAAQVGFARGQRSQGLYLRSLPKSLLKRPDFFASVCGSLLSLCG